MDKAEGVIGRRIVDKEETRGVEMMEEREGGREGVRDVKKLPEREDDS